MMAALQDVCICIEDFESDGIDQPILCGVLGI